MADIVKLATSIPAFAGVFPVAVGTHLSLEQPWSARNTSARKQRAFEASVELTERGFRTYAKVHFDRGRFRVGVIPLKRNRHQPPRYFELYDRSVPKTVWAFRSDMHKAWPAAPQMPALSNMTDPRPEFIPSVAAMLEPPLSSWLRVGRGKAAGFDCLLFEQTTGSPISGSSLPASDKPRATPIGHTRKAWLEPESNLILRLDEQFRLPGASSTEVIKKSFIVVRLRFQPELPLSLFRLPKGTKVHLRESNRSMKIPEGCERVIESGRK